MKRETLKVVENFDADQLALDIIKSTGTDESFFVSNVGNVLHKFKLWQKLMPRIHPHYAIKSNSHVSIAGTLAMLGAGNDCASRGEIDKVLAMGVKPSNIVFAHTVKPVSHINHAKSVGVDTMTFDNEEELYKIAKNFREAQLLLRLRIDSKSALKISFGEKFGCLPGAKSEFLLRKAHELGLNVRGTSFHIGEFCLDRSIYGEAIKKSAEAFQFGKSLGHKMDLLDIGGGYPGDETRTITETSKVINESLEKYFPDKKEVRVISEPGMYFSEQAMTLYVNVHSKVIKINEKGEEVVHYYITDGIYQSFGIQVIHDFPFKCRTLKSYGDKPLRKSMIWGRSCDSHDLVAQDFMLPEMECGDWLVIDGCGGYRQSTTTTFNGFTIHDVHNFIEKGDWETLQQSKVGHVDCLFDVVA